MNVLITGAHGTVGTAITDHLATTDRYEFTLLDREPGDGPGTCVVANVRNAAELRPHFQDQDAVIHLALTPGTGGIHDRELSWNDSLAANIEGIHNVFEAARDADLQSVIFASSNHAVGMEEVRNAPDIYWKESGIEIDHTEPHRPDSRYGLTKTYGEDLGRLAAEAHGLQFYALRIGAVREPQYDHPYGDAERGVDDGAWSRGDAQYDEQVARMSCLWQSRRDLAHMVDRCLQDEKVEWDQFYGRSRTPYSWLSIRNAREIIGYDPKDDVADWDGPPR